MALRCHLKVLFGIAPFDIVTGDISVCVLETHMCRHDMALQGPFAKRDLLPLTQRHFPDSVLDRLLLSVLRGVLQPLPITLLSAPSSFHGLVLM